MKKSALFVTSTMLAALATQTAKAQSTTVDATATVEAATPVASLTTAQNLSFGSVKIPRDETQGCMYVVKTSDSGIDFQGVTGLEKPQISPIGSTSQDVYRAEASGANYTLYETAADGCEFGGTHTPGIVRVSCSTNQAFDINVSATTDNGASYLGMDFYVPGQDLTGRLNVCQASNGGELSIYIGGMLYVDGTAQPYTGTVGTYTIDANFE